MVIFILWGAQNFAQPLLLAPGTYLAFDPGIYFVFSLQNHEPPKYLAYPCSSSVLQTTVLHGLCTTYQILYLSNSGTGMAPSIPLEKEFGVVDSAAMKSNEFKTLQRYIEDLEEEKFELRRGLDQQRQLAETLASENQKLSDDYNQQVCKNLGTQSSVRANFSGLCFAIA